MHVTIKIPRSLISGNSSPGERAFPLGHTTKVTQRKEHKELGVGIGKQNDSPAKQNSMLDTVTARWETTVSTAVTSAVQESGSKMVDRALVTFHAFPTSFLPDATICANFSNCAVDHVSF